MDVWEGDVCLYGGWSTEEFPLYEEYWLSLHKKEDRDNSKTGLYTLIIKAEDRKWVMPTQSKQKTKVVGHI